MKQKTLILGIGNDILTDDGIGPRLVQALKKDIHKDNLDFMAIAAGGLEILEILKDYQRVIILDAIKTMDGRPGDIYYLTPDSFRETLHISSFHDVSFLTALKLAEKIDIPIPEEINIIAIEILEDLTFSTEFSRPISEKYEDIYREVRNKVMALCQ